MNDVAPSTNPTDALINSGMFGTGLSPTTTAQIREVLSDVQSLPQGEDVLQTFYNAAKTNPQDPQTVFNAFQSVAASGQDAAHQVFAAAVPAAFTVAKGDDASLTRQNAHVWETAAPVSMVSVDTQNQENAVLRQQNKPEVWPPTLVSYNDKYRGDGLFQRNEEITTRFGSTTPDYPNIDWSVAVAENGAKGTVNAPVPNDKSKPVTGISAASPSPQDTLTVAVPPPPAPTVIQANKPPAPQPVQPPLQVAVVAPPPSALPQQAVQAEIPLPPPSAPAPPPVSAQVAQHDPVPAPKAVPPPPQTVLAASLPQPPQPPAPPPVLSPEHVVVQQAVHLPSALPPQAVQAEIPLPPPLAPTPPPISAQVAQHDPVPAPKAVPPPPQTVLAAPLPPPTVIQANKTPAPQPVQPPLQVALTAPPPVQPPAPSAQPAPVVRSLLSNLNPIGAAEAAPVRSASPTEVAPKPLVGTEGTTQTHTTLQNSGTGETTGTNAAPALPTQTTISSPHEPQHLQSQPIGGGEGTQGSTVKINAAPAQHDRPHLHDLSRRHVALRNHHHIGHLKRGYGIAGEDTDHMASLDPDKLARLAAATESKLVPHDKIDVYGIEVGGTPGSAIDHPAATLVASPAAKGSHSGTQQQAKPGRAMPSSRPHM